jgi:carbamoylphosphate synthase large subunit
MRALILTQAMWFGPARMPKSLKQHGFEVGAVCGPGEWITYSRFVDRLYHPPAWSGRTFLEFVIRTIEQWEPDILIPANDNLVMALQELRRLHFGGKANLNERAALALVASTCPNDSDALLASKFDLLEALKARGVAIPPQRELLTFGDADSFVAEFGYPILLKPDGSYGGVGILQADDEEELLGHLQNVLGGDRTQRYCIQKHLGEKTAVLEFSAKDGKLLCHGSAYRMKTYPNDMGPVSVMRICDSPEMLFAAQEICKLLRFNGIGCVQFSVEDDQCRNPKLLELNPRMTHLSHVWAEFGSDLVAALRDSLACLDVIPGHQNTGEVIALWPQEELRDPLSPYLAGRVDRVVDDPELQLAFETKVAGKSAAVVR